MYYSKIYSCISRIYIYIYIWIYYASCLYFEFSAGQFKAGCVTDSDKNRLNIILLKLKVLIQEIQYSEHNWSVLVIATRWQQ